MPNGSFCLQSTCILCLLVLALRVAYMLLACFVVMGSDIDAGVLVLLPNFFSFFPLLPLDISHQPTSGRLSAWGTTAQELNQCCFITRSFQSEACCTYSSCVVPSSRTCVLAVVRKCYKSWGNSASDLGNMQNSSCSSSLQGDCSSGPAPLGPRCLHVLPDNGLH